MFLQCFSQCTCKREAVHLSKNKMLHCVFWSTNDLNRVIQYLSYQENTLYLMMFLFHSRIHVSCDSEPTWKIPGPLIQPWIILLFPTFKGYSMKKQTNKQTKKIAVPSFYDCLFEWTYNKLSGWLMILGVCCVSFTYSSCTSMALANAALKNEINLKSFVMTLSENIIVLSK